MLDTTELDLAIEQMNLSVQVGLQRIISSVMTMTDDSITESIQSLNPPVVQEHLRMSRQELITIIEQAHNITGLTRLTLTGAKIGVELYEAK